MRKLLSLFIALSALMFSVAAHAQFRFATVSHLVDPGVCGSVTYTVTTSGYTPGLSVKALYGDGFSDTQAVGTSWYEAQSFHVYSFSGTYTVKLVLFAGSTLMDSAEYSAPIVTCNYFYIGGYDDLNNDCIWERAEPGIQNHATVEVDSAGVPVDTISWINRFVYPGYGAPGTAYAFRLLSPPTGMDLTCPSGGVLYDTVASGLGRGNPERDFAFQCTSTTDFDLGLNVSSTAGRSFRAYINAFNNYCTPEAATLTMTFSPKYTYSVSALPTPTSVSGTVITWDLPALISTAPSFIQVDLFENTVLLAGDTVHETYTITPMAGDINPANNFINEIDTISSSFDPNYKSVTPQGNILPGTTLQYTIHFENTGNDTAFNIYIMDTLSANLDPKSLSVLSASAAVNTVILNSGGYNIIKFDFPGIDLLDSTHHGQCYGDVVYSINAKSGLSVGAEIDNHAGIYFDDNPVVMTDTTVNMIGTPEISTIVNNTFTTKIYPNPATDILSISTNGSFTGATISNILGQVVISTTINVGQASVNVSSLPSGIYYVTLRGEDGAQEVKFVKR
jgi:uncharacterized repeat protein (TIGR01451 family)